jgi:hypothetical protein
MKKGYVNKIMFFFTRMLLERVTDINGAYDRQDSQLIGLFLGVRTLNNISEK